MFSSLEGEESDVEPITCFAIGQIDLLLLTSSNLCKSTREDPVLSRVLDYTRGHWPNSEALSENGSCVRKDQNK